MLFFLNLFLSMPKAKKHARPATKESSAAEPTKPTTADSAAAADDDDSWEAGQEERLIKHRHHLSRYRRYLNQQVVRGKLDNEEADEMYGNRYAHIHSLEFDD